MSKNPSIADIAAIQNVIKFHFTSISVKANGNKVFGYEYNHRKDEIGSRRIIMPRQMASTCPLRLREEKNSIWGFDYGVVKQRNSSGGGRDNDS